MKTERLSVHVHPGEVVWGDEFCDLHTITGSCIALCLWHPVQRIGGMAHFMLPGRSPGVPSGRYAEDALTLLLECVKKNRLKPGEFSFKLFGGARLSPSNRMGSQNQVAIHALLSTLRLEPVARDLGGTCSRKILFRIATGEAFVKRQDILKPRAAS